MKAIQVSVALYAEDEEDLRWLAKKLHRTIRCWPDGLGDNALESLQLETSKVWEVGDND